MSILRLILLGPARCQGCGALVWWSLTWSWDGWTERGGQRHRCVAEKREAA